MTRTPAHRAHLELAQWFYDHYQARIVEGAPKYGDFNPATDKRNMGSECIAEILDVGSYLEFGEQMRPDLTSHIQKMRAKTIILCGMARRLEEMMRTTEKEGTK